MTQQMDHAQLGQEADAESVPAPERVLAGQAEPAPEPAAPPETGAPPGQEAPPEPGAPREQPSLWKRFRLFAFRTTLGRTRSDKNEV